MATTLSPPDDDVFQSMGFQVHHWAMHDGDDVVVLQKEPLRMEWYFTQVVTFLFLIRRHVDAIDELDHDFAPLLAFAKAHKRTWLPRGLQCGYALLPVYVGTDFNDDLKRRVRALPKKRWCLFHAPSLFDVETMRLTTVTGLSLWGRVYADYIYRTIGEATQVLVADAAIHV